MTRTVPLGALALVLALRARGKQLPPPRRKRTAPPPPARTSGRWRGPGQASRRRPVPGGLRGRPAVPAGQRRRTGRRLRRPRHVPPPRSRAGAHRPERRGPVPGTRPAGRMRRPRPPDPVGPGSGTVVFAPVPVRSGRDGERRGPACTPSTGAAGTTCRPCTARPCRTPSSSTAARALHGRPEALFDGGGSAGCVNLAMDDAAALWDLLSLEDLVYVWGTKPGTAD